MSTQIKKLPLRGCSTILAVGILLCGSLAALGQSQDPKQPQQTEPVQPINQAAGPTAGKADVLQPATPTALETKTDEVPAAVVIEIRGSVEWAPAGADVLAAEGWTAVKVGDRLKPGTLIRTGLRSHVNLSFGETTVVSFRSVTHGSIDQYFRSATKQTARLGLAYGTVRGGSTEGELRSDVTVHSTVAALLKRGTEGWEMYVEPMTGRFRISLAEYGLVEAIQKLASGRRVRRSVRPGEYATHANIANMWIKQNIFDRNVRFYESEALTAADAEFAATSARGYGSIAPGGGSTLADVSARVNADFVLDQIASNEVPSMLPMDTAILERLPIVRPEGNFGTGPIFRVLVPAPRMRVR